LPQFFFFHHFSLFQSPPLTGEGKTTLYLHRKMTRSACPPGLAWSRL
jgi:hypothetical protein